MMVFGVVVFIHAIVLVTATPHTQKKQPNKVCRSYEECSKGVELHHLNLHKTLITRYNQLNPRVAARPVLNHEDVVDVKYGLSMVDMLNYDETSRTLRVVTWDKMEWNDVLLKWNPSQYGGIESITLPASAIWRPDLTLYNSITHDAHIIDDEVVVSSDGTVLYIPHLIKQVKCTEQTKPGTCKNIICQFKIGSWVHSGNQMNIQFFGNKAELVLDNYNEDWRYHLVRSSAVRQDKTYPLIIFTTVFNKMLEEGYCETTPKNV